MFNRLRLYHSAVGLLAMTAYLSEDWTSFHVWIGYAVATLLCFRILSLPLPRVMPRPAWMVRRTDHQPKLGLRNPVISKAFIAAIMASLVLTITTGIVLDQSPSLAKSGLIFTTSAQADERVGSARRKKADKAVKEVHEFAANSMLFVVSLHIGYLLLLRRQYALRMIFIDPKRQA